MDANVVSRRELLRLWGAAGAFYLLAGDLSAAQDLVPARTAVDHLAFGINDLDEGIAWLERMTGVKAVIGGSHPGWGTRNALISLGGRQYLEIIAPDPAQTVYKPLNFQTDLRILRQPRLIFWAAATSDIAAIAENALRMALPIVGPIEGSRARPDGRVLQWKALLVRNKFAVQAAEPIPFFIEWAAGSVHPSQDSPKGCELLSLEFEHPDPVGLLNALKSLGIEARATQARNARLRATLKTPKGAVELN
ncbi:MAG: VOC family protein [Terriglobia bacterium]